MGSKFMVRGGDGDKMLSCSGRMLKGIGLGGLGLGTMPWPLPSKVQATASALALRVEALAITFWPRLHH